MTRLITSVAVLALLSGCNRNTFYSAPSVDGLRFTAGTAILSDTLAVTAHAVNRSTKPVHLEFSQCKSLSDLSIELQHGDRLWSSRTWELQRAKAIADTTSRRNVPVCVPYGLSTSLNPGASFPYVLRVALQEVRGDSLGAGSYRVIARIDINGRHIKHIMAGEIHVPPPPDTR